MAKVHNEEFKREAVRIALTSGQPRRQVASDLGVGFSTLAKWIQKSRPADLPPAADIDLAKENERLRKENRLLTEERELLKKATVGSTGQRNGSFEGISRRLEVRRFSRPRVKPQGNLIKVTLGVDG